MSLAVRKRWFQTLALACALGAPMAYGQMSGLNPTASEIAQLPQFCWAQMGVPNTDAPQFKPNACGAGTNHYCPALVKLIRAKRRGDPGKAYRDLDGVESAIRYTEQWIQGFPSCSMRNHLETTKAEVKRLRSAYGGTRTQKKTKP